MPVFVRNPFVFLAAMLVVPALGLFPLSTSAQDLGTAVATKENLDLPYDAVGEPDDDPTAPDEYVFYTHTLEGDGIFYVIDRSSSMAQGELEVAKRELVRNITEFSDRIEFGIVFFDASVVRFPASGAPAQATEGMKAAAAGFVQSMQPGLGSCVEQGLAAGLRMANLSTKRHKVLVYLGDGGGTCQGAEETAYLRKTLASVTADNYQRIRIDAIGILNPAPLSEDFMRRLAANNGGTYLRVAR